MAAAIAHRRSDALGTALADKVQHYLDVGVYDNALFLAERLVAHHRCDEHLLLLATCFYRSGRPNQAIAVLDGTTQPLNRYLLALCCFEQHKLVDAENALRGTASSDRAMFRDADDDDGDDDGLGTTHIPNGAAGLYLMGRICRRMNRRDHAIEFFVKSLALDAMLFVAYEQLCELGADMDAAQFFGDATYWTSDQSDDAHDNNTSDHSASSDASASTRNRLHTTTTTTLSTSTGFETPGVRSTSDRTKKPRVNGNDLPPPNARKNYRRPLAESDDAFRRNTRLSFSSTVSEDATPLFTKPTAAATTEAAIPPLATRLFQDADDANNHTPVPATARATTRSQVTTMQQQRLHGQRQLLRLLSTMGGIYQRQCAFQCREALAMLEQLPATQRASGWCQQQIGRAHFELADYTQARDAFQALHQHEPHRLDGLAVYSTTLWHLKHEVELSFLAQHVTEFDNRSSEAWCVAGNCFSLQKEHDTALAFFQRAIQLDPTCTYAYTLSGHEYVANEDFEAAMRCYRHALRIDARHYNAWYGLGTIYFRQEKYALAELHFRHALAIHPRSSLLHCFLGMVLHATQQFDDALRVLAIASELQPRNVQARFQRANVLMSQRRLDDALLELERVRNVAPRESSVHFLIGQVAKQLGRPDDALRSFTTALYFHPKDNNVIKAAIDKIYEVDFDADDDDDDERL